MAVFGVPEQGIELRSGFLHGQGRVGVQIHRDRYLTVPHLDAADLRRMQERLSVVDGL